MLSKLKSLTAKSKDSSVFPKKKDSSVFPKKKVTFIDLPNHSIAQIYGSGLQYALASDNNEQACHFVFCKDFFQDAYQGYMHGVPRGIFGFNYDPIKNKPLAMRSAKLIVINLSDAHFSDKVIAAKEFMNQIEKDLKFRKKTEFYEISNPPKWVRKNKVFLLESNRTWLLAPTTISLFTLLVRIAFLHKKGTSYTKTIDDLCNGKIKPYQSNDRSYMSSGYPGLVYILRKGIREVFGRNMYANFPSKMSIDTMHNGTGIVAFCSGGLRRQFPDWFKGFDPSKMKVQQNGKYAFPSIKEKKK